MTGWLEPITKPLGAAGQTVKKLIETRDLLKFGDTFRELYAEILAATQGALDAQARESALLQRIRELEEIVRSFETWEAEKNNYELKALGWGAYAFMLKRDARGSKPPHWVCAHCYCNGKAEILQHPMIPGEGQRWVCPACKNRIHPASTALTGGEPRWLDD